MCATEYVHRDQLQLQAQYSVMSMVELLQVVPVCDTCLRGSVG